MMTTTPPQTETETTDVYPRVVYQNDAIRVVRRDPRFHKEYYDIEYPAQDAMKQLTWHHVDGISGERARHERYGMSWRDALIVDLLHVKTDLEAQIALLQEQIDAYRAART